jgi:hypothetical protein
VNLLEAKQKIHGVVTVIEIPFTTLTMFRVWSNGNSAPVCIQFEHKDTKPLAPKEHLETIPIALILSTMEEKPEETLFFLKPPDHYDPATVFAVRKMDLIERLETEGHLQVYETEKIIHGETVECANCGQTHFQHYTVTVDSSGGRVCKPCAEHMKKSEVCASCGKALESSADVRTCATCKGHFCTHCIEHCHHCGRQQCDTCYAETHGHRRGHNYCDGCHEEFAECDLIREDGQYLCPDCYEARTEWDKWPLV